MILRLGSRGDEVRKVQERLFVADGRFGAITEGAVMGFQRARGLPVTGAVDENTWEAMFPTETRPITDPTKPPFRAMTTDEKDRIFGHIEYRHAPLRDNPENVEITNDFEDRNIVSVFIPELKGIPYGWGGVCQGNVRLHKLAAPQFLGVMSAIREAGFLGDLITYDGGFTARFVRGSTRTLSNHCYGTAMDFNAQWNPLNKEPAWFGERGCLRRWIPILHQFGIFWGGHFARRDGMHVEIAKLF